MIDIEILTAILKELGYLDDSDDEEGKEGYSEKQPTSKPEQKEQADEDEQS